MSLRGKAAIVGIGEVPTRRVHQGRSLMGLCAEATALALSDAGLKKEDIDGLVTDGVAAPPQTAEYIGIKPQFATGVAMQGASGATATMVAAAAINAGICNTALVVMGNSREEGERQGRIAGRGAAGPSVRSEWEEPYGMAPGANTGYGLIYRRHMHEYGTTEEQMAKMAADQRFNAQDNPNAVFNGQPASKEDVLNSRYINEPLKLLESVMPCDGAAALIITSPERAKTISKRPAYILGVGLQQGEANIWQRDKFTETPAIDSARRALAMAGYEPSDMEFAEFYD
ncbi:MAG: acetyl-CoA acetyltransferase [Chloroflexi bacterium]|nr:acetyl-CoA acetyltransferase [Chloroflexota bacterium]|tara:strand:+ start:341 stop:1198 length:858 start_codon:yes stop_codon:yes gene_type:complete